MIGRQSRFTTNVGFSLISHKIKRRDRLVYDGRLQSNAVEEFARVSVVGVGMRQQETVTVDVGHDKRPVINKPLCTIYIGRVVLICWYPRVLPSYLHPTYVINCSTKCTEM